MNMVLCKSYVMPFIWENLFISLLDDCWKKINSIDVHTYNVKRWMNHNLLLSFSNDKYKKNLTTFITSLDIY